MFQILKKLVKQTAIYGVSTIVVRMLNYLLVPFYTRIFLPEEYGVITELYAYMGFLLILLTYGLETGYFRHTNLVKDEKSLFSSLLFVLGISSISFVIISSVFSHEIASFIDYQGHSEYILYLCIIIALDAFTALPFARLRYLDKSIYFVLAKLFSVLLNISLILFFYLLVPYLIKFDEYAYLSDIFTDLETVKYVFISNVVTSAFSFVILIPQLRIFTFRLDYKLLKKVMSYSFPLLLVGFTGIGIESLDKILLKHLISVPSHIVDSSRFVMSQIGIYGANFKLAVFMSLFIQAYRFASEPLFFAQAKEGNAKLVYAAMMKYFVIFGLFIFLGIMLYLDIVKIFISETYFEGLFIVPILLIAKLFFGIVFSLSIWYKVTNLTKFGIIISSSGLLVSLIINLIFIPYYSYEASSWAALFAYLTMAVVSYFLSRKFYKISYDFKSIGFYFLSALSIFMLYYFSKKYFISFWYVYSTVMFALFAAIVVYKENLVVIIRNRFLK